MTDFFLYNGELARFNDLKFIEMIADKQASDDCSLILVTRGGDPDAAYKIGKYIQRRYESFTVLVSGMCKSAGTLLAISASDLVFTPYGELGPLDVQMIKEDKLFGTQSGLNISEAFRAIEERAKDTYHSLIGEILTGSEGAASFQTALHAASEMVNSLYSPIFKQIDPEEVGSRSRAMRIGEDYTERLNAKWENLKEDQTQVLSRAYPSHSFVIDIVEAEVLFNRVRLANDDEMKLVESLGIGARLPGESLRMRHLEVENERIEKGDEDVRTKSAKAVRRERPRKQREQDGGNSAAAG